MNFKYLETLLDQPEEFTPPPVEEQQHIFNGKMWKVENLVKYADTLPSYMKPLSELRALVFESGFPGLSQNPTYAELAYHTRVSVEADLSFPIILGEDGRIVDGHHRVLKALIEGKTHILCVQFVLDPEPDEYLS